MTNDTFVRHSTLTPLFFRVHLLTVDGVGQVVKRESDVVVAGEGATAVGGKEAATVKLPQAVAPYLTLSVHEAAVDPATCSVDLRSEYFNVQ